MGSVFAAALSATSASQAGPIPYPNVGTPNPVTYTFTAPVDGTITAYFAGSTASYDEQVGLLVNGVSTGVVGLDDHSSMLGQSLNLTPLGVHAGDVLTFVDYVYTSGNTWYSNPALNVDMGNHVYSTDAVANQVYSGSPAGTYVAFEDLEFPHSDYNYFDDTFIFTDNGLPIVGAPGPMPGAGVAGLAVLALYGAARLRRA
jgi:hypothetical protein